MAEDVNLALRVQLNKLRQDLSQGGAITEAKAQEMLIPLERQWKKTELSARRATQAMAKQADKDFDAVKKAGDKMTGGMIGDFEDLAKGAGGLVSALGPVGAALAGAAVVGVGGLAVLTGGTVAATQAVYGMITSGEEALATLRQLGAAEGVNPSAVAALERWTHAAAQANVEVLELSANIGGDLASAFGDAPARVAILADSLSGLTGTMTGLVETWREWDDTLTFGLASVLSTAAGFDELGDKARKVQAGWDDQRAAIEQGRQASEAAIQKSKELVFVHEQGVKADAEATKKRADAHREAVKFKADEKKAQDELNAKYLDAFKVAQQARDDEQSYHEWRNGVLRKAAAEDLERQNLIALGQENIRKSEEERAQQFHERETKRLQERADGERMVREMAVQAALDSATAIGAIMEELAGRRIEEAKAYQDKHVEAYEKAREKYEESSEGMTAVEKARAKAELASLKNNAAVAKRQARARAKDEYDAQVAGFYVQQGAQMIAATIAAGQAAVALMVPLAFLGPGAPAAAALIAAAGLVPQLAMMAIQKPPPPPKFHQGRTSDEIEATLLRDERVVTARGAQALGGDEAIKAANAGMATPMSAPPITLNFIMPDGSTQTSTADLQPQKRGRVISGWVGQVDLSIAR